MTKTDEILQTTAAAERKSSIKAPQKVKNLRFKGLMDQSWVICQLLKLINSSFRICLGVVVIVSKNCFVNCAKSSFEGTWGLLILTEDSRQSL